MEREIVVYETELKNLQSRGWVKEIVATYGPMPDMDSEHHGEDMHVVKIVVPETELDTLLDYLGIPR